MNIHRHVLFLLAVFIIPFQAVSAFAGDACEKVDIDFMHRHLTIPPHTSIASKAPVNGLCQVILNIDGTYFTTYASDGGYVILGKMYSDQAILDGDELSRLHKFDFMEASPELEKCVAIHYRPKGPVKNVVYMITDPLCPYCNLATGQMKTFADEHSVELKIAFFSVHGAAGDEKAIEAVCRNFTLSEYMQDAWKQGDGKKYQCEKGKALIEKARPLARNLHVQGVPTFFLHDGTEVVGANMERLEKALQE